MLIRITGLEPAPILASYSTFAADNSGALDAAALADIHARLLGGQTVTLGGGAAPLVTIAALGAPDRGDAAAEAA